MQALIDNQTRYPDVRGLSALRAALSTYLSGLHAKPVAESRIQVTASGMAAISAAMPAVVRAGHRVVVHSPTWPNIANAVLLRGAEVEEICLDAQPDGSFRLDLDRLDTLWTLLWKELAHSSLTRRPIPLAGPRRSRNCARSLKSFSATVRGWWPTRSIPG